jgi:hypothetical protein
MGSHPAVQGDDLGRPAAVTDTHEPPTGEGAQHEGRPAVAVGVGQLRMRAPRLPGVPRTNLLTTA